tara:strand:+ start:245 stop:571 length:327 start_codon:yes stop_codon:yes gene_type:complete
MAEIGDSSSLNPHFKTRQGQKTQQKQKTSSEDGSAGQKQSLSDVQDILDIKIDALKNNKADVEISPVDLKRYVNMLHEMDEVTAQDLDLDPGTVDNILEDLIDLEKDM